MDPLSRARNEGMRTVGGGAGYHSDYGCDPGSESRKGRKLDEKEKIRKRQNNENSRAAYVAANFVETTYTRCSYKTGGGDPVRTSWWQQKEGSISRVFEPPLTFLFSRGKNISHTCHAHTHARTQIRERIRDADRVNRSYMRIMNNMSNVYLYVHFELNRQGREEDA